MPTTYTELHYHCIWSTKNREPLITEAIESSVWSVIAATASTHGVRARKIGGIENYVHALIDIPATLSVSEAMKRIRAALPTTSTTRALAASSDPFAGRSATERSP